MVILVTAVAIATQGPLAWPATARDGAAAVTYISNIIFANRATNYFDQSSHSLFLHTWSLSLEEQFYIFWPLAIYLFYKLAPKPKDLRIVFRCLFILLTVLSLLSSVALTYRGTAWAFFSFPTRIWQFSLAALLGTYNPQFQQPLTRRLGVSAGVIGILFILFSSITFDDRTAYPGTAALIPTIGALLIVWSGQLQSPPILSRIIATGPTVALGRLSYSWYLWHWPFIVIASQVFRIDKSGYLLTASILALIPASLSYRYVERPFRYSPMLLSSVRRSFAICILFVAVSLAASGFLYAAHLSQMKSPLQMRLVEAQTYGPSKDCFDDAGTCHIGNDSAPFLVAVVGDSHSSMLIPALYEAARIRPNIRFIVRQRGNCPAINVRIASQRTGRESTGCRDFRSQTAHVLDDLKPDVVVAASTSYIGLMIGDHSPNAQLMIWRRAMGDYAREQLSEGRAFGIVTDGPRWPFDPIQCASRTRSLSKCSIGRRPGAEHGEATRRVERKVALSLGIPMFPMMDVVCKSSRCPLEQSGRIVMADSNHITSEFSSHMGARISAWIGELVSSSVD